MRKTVSFIAILFATAVPAAAEEQPLRFVHALRQNGYGDMAVEYLKMLAKRPDLSQEVRKVWDLEMSKSLKSAAAAAFNAKERARLMKKSQEHLAKFLRDHPDHSATAIAAASLGDFLMMRALELIHSAKTVKGKDPPRQEKYLTDARADLVEARNQFQQARKKLTARLAALPPLEKDLKKLPARKADRAEALETRAEAETNLQDAQFQLALIEYYLGQTYADPTGPKRIAALTNAGKAFDDIFQRSRRSTAGLSVTGLYAHVWHGKTADELGDFRLALDIYDEALANAPEPNDKGPATGLEPLFAQVEYFRLLILAKRDPEQFFAEATAWLQYYRRLRHTDGYQGIALELAKATFEWAEGAAGPEKTKRIAETLRILGEMSRVRSQYQQEAVLLRRDALRAAGRSDFEVNTFEEAAALGDAAAAGSQWEQAQKAYEKALAIAEKTKRDEPSRIAAVRDALAGVQLMIARGLFEEGKWNECAELAGNVVFEDPQRQIMRKDSATAAQAAALAVAAALNLYVEVPDDAKPAALEKLIKVAEFTERHWPDRPEADDARMARAQAKLVVGQVRQAIDVFDRVNPKSERYPLAMYMAGQNYWHLYVLEKLKPEEARDDGQMAADRAKAVQRLSAGQEALKNQLELGKPPPKYFFDAQLLLAEIYAEGGDMQQAVTLYQPLVDLIEIERPENFDATTIHVFLGAVRAYSALGELDKAGQIGATLIELGPDTPRVNAVLIELARLLELERKKAAATVTELESAAKYAELIEAKKQLASVRNLLGGILVELAGRQQLSAAGMVFIGDALNAVGMINDASRQYDKILDRMKTDPQFAKSAEPAKTRVLARSVGLLRRQGDLEKALQRVEQLLEDHPNVLEPLMEKGRILEGLAEKDPARFGDAVSHWVTLRTRLQPLRKKPAEYYDVMYNVAACLVREAEKSNNDQSTVMERAKQAEQVLKAALILTPKLNGPDTVVRYKTLLNKAIAMQGRSPERNDAKPDGKKDDKKP